MTTLAQEVTTEADEEPKPEVSSRPANIVVDRPSFAFPTSIVGKGVFSVESGVLVTRSKGGEDVLTTTPLILRMGSSDNFEYRVTSNGLNFQSDHAGWSDLSAGFKWRLVDKDSVSLAVLTSLNAPVGASKFTNDAVSGSLTFLANFPINDDNGILINLGTNTTGNSGRDDVLVGFFTAGLSHNVTEKLSLYFEVAGFSPQEVGGSSTMAGDIVCAYLVNPDFQLDIAGFKGFSSTGLDWGATFGMAHRF
jgi:outer membrane putative beta-barrel porin/alpha-amylase